jgi:hypothetical protein
MRLVAGVCAAGENGSDTSDHADDEGTDRPDDTMQVEAERVVE